LRGWLADNGYSIDQEQTILCKGKTYIILEAVNL